MKTENRSQTPANRNANTRTVQSPKSTNQKTHTTPTFKAKNRIATRSNAAKSPAADQKRKVHEEYLRILQKYYDGKYVDVQQKFFAKFGQRGERARTPNDKSKFENFLQKRNKLFQGSKRAYVSQLLQSRNIDMDELYTLTDEHQQGMRDTMEDLESML